MIAVTPLAQLLDGVDGFLAPDEPDGLARLASEVPDGHSIVEVGAYRGRSTIALAYGAPDGVIVTSVDPHDEHRVESAAFGMIDNQCFLDNLARAHLGHKVRIWNLRSAQAVSLWSGKKYPLGLVFIDGSHEDGAVHFDVVQWGMRLAVGGKLALHDSTGAWVYPTREADALSATPCRWTELTGFGYTRVFRKEPG